MSAIVPFVGRHLVPDAPPPPKAKPPYRFLLAMGAIVVLAVVAMAVVAALYPERGPAVADSGQDSSSIGALPPPPPSPPVTLTPAPGQPSATQTPPAGPPPPATATSPATPGAVTGSYAVTHTDQEWGNKFEVRISLRNSSGTEQPWVVTLEYPSRVTGFAAAWTEPGQIAPQQIVNQPLFTVSGNQPIPAGATLTVWIQLNVNPGPPVTLLSCRVNGSACQQI
jgi:hypothetical protein